jgi:hypothetical protein
MRKWRLSGMALAQAVIQVITRRYSGVATLAVQLANQ